MTQARTTKRALLLSCISMLLCMSMLVGTTFAWFTDTATTGVNTIVAGNLDIVLEYWNGTAWAEVDEDTLLFDKDALYEPGFTEVAYLKVRNNGSLALKYNLNINVANEVAGKTVDGKAILLSEHLKFGVITSELNKDVTIFGTRADAQKAVESTAAGLKSYSTNGYVELAPESYYTMALVIYMPTTVGNEANHDGVNIPKIDLGVNVFATQKDSEKDSFDNQYDKNAPTLITVEGSSVAYATINEAFEKTGATTFNVSGPIDVTQMNKVFATANQNVTFNQLEGHMDAYYDFSGNAIINANGASITFNGGYIQGNKSNALTGYGINHTSGTITYNGVTINDTWTNQHNATVVYKDCKFTGAAYVYTYAVPSATFDHCVFDKADSRAIQVYNETDNALTVTIKDCEFYAAAKGYTWDGKWTAAVEVNAALMNTYGATVNISGCTIDSNYNGIARDKAGKNATITVDNAPFITSQVAFEAAIANEKAKIVLGAGNYTMVNTNYDVTITGTKDAILSLPNGVAGYSNTITFDGITIQGNTDPNKDNWRTEQLKNASKAVYKNCTINDLITVYPYSEFDGCVFENDLADQYSVFCYSNAKITDCTFNTPSKAIKVYQDGDAALTVEVTNCTFNASEVDKAAVEIDSTNNTTSKYTVTISNCTINEYYTKLVSDRSVNSVVTVNGNVVVVNDAALQNAINNAQDGETIYLAAGQFNAVGKQGVNVKLVGAVDANGAPATTLYNATLPSHNGSGVWEYASKVEFENIIFKAAEGIEGGYAPYQSALNIENGTDAVFTNCKFVNQGLHISGDTTFTRCVFEGNDSGYKGIFLAPLGTCAVVLDECEFSGYTFTSINVQEAAGSTMTIKNSTISGTPIEIGALQALTFENCTLNCNVIAWLADTTVTIPEGSFGAGYSYTIYNG